MFFVQLWSLHNSVIHTLSLNNCCLLRSYILWVTYFGQYLWTKCTHVVNNGQTIGYSKGFSLLQWTFIARAIVFRFAVGDIIFFSTYCYLYLQFSTNPMLTHYLHLWCTKLRMILLYQCNKITRFIGKMFIFLL